MEEKGSGTRPLDFKGHCLFCLEECKSKIGSEDSYKIIDFQPVIHYLTGTDPTVPTDEECRRKGVPVMTNSPPMCQKCSEVMAEIGRLHEKLEKIQKLLHDKTLEGRRIVKEAAPRRRKQFFRRIKKSEMSGVDVEFTCGFVKDLHDIIFAADEKNVMFPTYERPPIIKQEVEDVEEMELEAESMIEFPNDADLEYSCAEPDPLDVKPLFRLSRRAKINASLQLQSLKKVKARPQTLKMKTEEVVRNTKRCAFCQRDITRDDLFSHMESHVDDFATKCLNPACKLVFPCHSLMLTHLRRKNLRHCQKFAKKNKLQTMWECSTCGDFQSNSRRAFHTHVRDHEDDQATKKLKCPLPNCSEVYALKQSLDIHLISHCLPPKTEQKCSICSQTISLTEITKHYKESHKVSEIFNCKRCPYQFPSQDELIDHLFIHRNDNGVYCDLCDTEINLKLREQLHRHYFNVHGVGELEEFKCEICSASCPTKMSFSGHMRRQHPEVFRPTCAPKVKEAKLHKCNLCSATFRYREALRTHKITDHQAQNLLTCKICGIIFATQPQLKFHMSEHAGLQQDFKCDVEGCDKVFQQRYMLSRHRRTAHTQTTETRHVCKICGKSYQWADGLRRHHKQEHLGIRHICETCGKSFMNPMTLKQHYRIHTGERPYTCERCGQSFRQQSTLHRHQISHDKQGDAFKPNGPKDREVRSTKGVP